MILPTQMCYICHNTYGDKGGSLPKVEIHHSDPGCPLNIIKMYQYTVLVKSFAHLNGNFFLVSLEEIGKLWNWWTVYSGVLHHVQS